MEMIVSASICLAFLIAVNLFFNYINDKMDGKDN